MFFILSKSFESLEQMGIPCQALFQTHDLSGLVRRQSRHHSVSSSATVSIMTSGIMSMTLAIEEGQAAIRG